MTTLHPLPPPATDPGATARLAARLARHAPADGVFELPIPGVHAIRASRISTSPVHGLQGAALCIVAQGAKTVFLGADAYDYDPARMLLFSLDLPIAARIRRASPALPYLCFRLDLDPARIAALLPKVYPDGLPRRRDERAVHLARAGEAIVDAAARLLALADDDTDARLLGPLVVEEILVRLLRSPVGDRLAQVGLAESNVHRVGRAVAWLRDHYAMPVSVDDLAARAHMSPSSLHQHFKAATSMSPIQYQKALRLLEARGLLADGMGAAAACARVGYASASQFSREYARRFGCAPSRDGLTSRGRTGDAGAA